MNTVTTLLQSFQSALLRDQAAPAGLLTPLSAPRFDVYRDAYRARLRGALRENFEVLPLVMGDEDFDALANAYIEAHPSTHYSLRWFGHSLSSFMAQHDDLVPHPAMVDLARMEWALRTAFDAASSDAIAAEALGRVQADEWPDLRFGLHPSVQLLVLQWAVGPVWHAFKNAEQDDVPPPDALDHQMLVWRLELSTQWKTLDTAETAFVESLRDGRSFGSICEALVAVVGQDQAPHTAANLLRTFLGNGVISSVHMDADLALIS